jgi:urease accessory protein
MITINSVLGNFNKDLGLQEKHKEMSKMNLCETIRIHRSESQRVRMRKTSDKGTDIALTLPQGTQLRHNDVVMLTQDKMIVVEIEPENVALVLIKENIGGRDSLEIPVRIGHTIGNLHRPIRIDGRKIYFPVQADTEIEMFRRLLDPVIHHIEISKIQMVFEPEEGMHMHEH